MRENLILYNPASELELPKPEKRLPKHTLTTEEAEHVLTQPDIDTDTGIRDRAILEVLYSTGIRRQEVINLTRQDVNVSAGVIAVRQGKGKKDRFVPIGERALLWVEKYLDDVRPQHALPSSPDNVFLDETGKELDPHKVSRAVKKYVKHANLNKVGSCHLFRHTMATLMLENGADIRFIQQMLGHSMLSTTEIYTHVAIHKLKEIHTATHPARLKSEGQRQTTDTNEPTAQDLLDALAAEAEDEADT
jgi:integrase/recombinase XerD